MEGLVQKVTYEESEQYFCSRPREIQIAPAVSNQVYVWLFSPVPSLFSKYASVKH